MYLFVSPLQLPNHYIRKNNTKCKSKPSFQLYASANINQTNDSNREDEIAAKIASLRKYKKLKSQQSPTVSSESIQQNQDDINDINIKNPQLEQNDNSTFNQLPDWKKEQVMTSQIEEAENFFNKSTIQTDLSSSQLINTNTEKNQDDSYKPKVSTWGLFPRPDNISTTYGGGKRIRQGGVDLKSKKVKEQDEKVAQKLAAYRASRGIDIKKEEEHREEIDIALQDAQQFMRCTKAYDAIDKLETVKDYVSAQSRLGGKVLLTLAFAYEAVGQREDAKQLYIKLKKSPFPEISSNAKRLLQGFQDMINLGVVDETSQKGLTVSNFVLPDLNYASDKRYETVIMGIKSNSLIENDDDDQILNDNPPNTRLEGLILFVLLLVPLSIIFLAKTIH